MSGSFDNPYGGSVTTESTLLSSNVFNTSKQSPCNSNSFVLFLLIKLSPFRLRSEERRVGKECRSRWARYGRERKASSYKVAGEVIVRTGTRHMQGTEVR